MIGTTLAHYKILSKLGEGGMGAVYLAEDSKLGRRVALKVLPEAMATDPERLARFEREAKSVAALNHPNIITVYSIEQDADIRFITMELVEGKPLERLIPPGGLDLATFFELGIPLADALAVAHGKGITHRDLKPANVMVSDEDRLLKILDFGLAKYEATSTEREESEATLTAGLTAAGAIMGTVPYMSPEQVEGKPLDSRTDIFSLGIILYEMLTGERPFQGESAAGLTSAILRDAPRPLTESRVELPRHLERIVSRCLEKEPKTRFQTARDVCNELKVLRREVESGVSPAVGPVSDISPSESLETPTAMGRRGKRLWIGFSAAAVVVASLVVILGRSGRLSEPQDPSAKPAESMSTTAAVPEHNSIAVLPFVNRSSDKEQEYFSDGIAEELLNLLARVTELRVISRTSAFSLKGQELGLPEIARRLNVAHVLEGSVRKAGKQVRITAQLIEAASDKQLWSDTYDRTLEDIFTIQDEIAADVVEKLKVALLGEVPTARESDPEAYALMLEGRHLARLGTAEGLAQAIGRLQESLTLDSESAAAWTELASVYATQAGRSLLPPDEGYQLAREAVNKALAIDNRTARAHSLLGWIAIFYDRDLNEAARHLERGLHLEPGNVDVLSTAAVLAGFLGRLDQAIAFKERRILRDPLSPGGHSGLGGSYYHRGRWDQAIASYRTALRLSPGRIGAQFIVGSALLFKGEPEAALEAMREESYEVFRLMGSALAYHALGRRTDSDATLAELIESYEKDAAYNIAFVLAYRGEIDPAFDWLEKALAYNDPGLAEIAIEPLFANLHPDPRWLRFLREIGQAPEQLAAIEFNVTLPE